MGPTALEVRGVPVPGVRGVPPPRDARGPQFRAILERMLPARPAAATAPRAPAALAPSTRVHPVEIAPRRPAREPVLPTFERQSLPVPAGGRKAALAASIRHAAGRAGVEPALSVAVARAESNLDPRARSQDGLSVGTFQVTHYTKAEMRRKIAAGTVARPPGSDDVALGVGYLRYLHDLFGRRASLARGLATVPIGDAAERQRFAVAAFNAGEGRVAGAQARAAAAGGDPTRFADVRPYLPPITQRYVERVMTYAREEPRDSTPV
jgi:soluble lytic murein transglycosylase-like protein